MQTTFISGRMFNQSSSEARRAANNGPVIITDHGRPAHVLMSMEHYSKLGGSRKNIIELLAMDGDIELELPDFSGELARPADIS